MGQGNRGRRDSSSRWSWARAALAAAGVTAAACSGTGPDDPEQDADAAPDPASIDCQVATPSADIGTCRDQGGEGMSCYLVTEPQDPQLVPITEGETLDMVRGPQGADMFVMGLRTGAGLVPGGVDLDHPGVNIDLYMGSERVANYRASIVFSPDDGADSVSAQGMFVVLQGPGTAFQGETLQAIARIEDREGSVRCGRVGFVVGEISSLP